VSGLRTFICAGLLLIALSLIVWAYPPLFMAGLSLAGHTPLCGSGEILRGAGQYYRQQKIKDSFAGRIRIRTRDPAGYNLYSTPDGDFWLPRNSDEVLPILLAQQNVDLYGLGGRGVRRGDVVLDCGAHVGLYTKTALRAGAKLVVAIEPAPANLECLRRNLKAEIAAGKVIVCPKGVWDKIGILPLYENAGNTAGDSFLDNGAGTVVAGRIPLTTIDALAAELHLPRVDFIKMDIKGAAEKALVGGRGTLGAFRPRLAISSEENNDPPAAVSRAVDALGLGYRRNCGSCTLENGTVSPDVLFFHSPAGPE
jgi:FkbM family methyltransferase